MTFAEFRQWAGTNYGHWIRLNGDSEGRRACWATDSLGRAKARTGSGNDAEYGLIQQRRFAVWLRTRGLVSPRHVAAWLAAGEFHDRGWLVNDGSGIRWVSDPEEEWKDLLGSGFIAIRCGTGI